MWNIVFGIALGSILPIQTTINGRLKKATGSPFRASQISAAITFLVLVLVLVFTGEGFRIPIHEMMRQPVWIWMGGICGAVILIGSITVFLRLGAVQAAILPVAGQILMGMIIDSFGLFHSEKNELTLLRVIGAVLVFTGLIIITRAKFESGGAKTDSTLLPYQILGIFIGMANATQIAVNAYLKIIVGSALKATLVNNVICNLVVQTVCFLVTGLGISHAHKPESFRPWWMWIGGILGMVAVVGNIFIALRAGTGYAVILLLMGTAVGGVLIDHFGLFEAPKKKITPKKLFGIILMLTGTAFFRLLGQ